jgi:hypothetical protein
MGTEMNEQAAVEPRDYGRLARIIVCVISFGMIFPNAIIEGMERPQLLSSVADDVDAKKR